MSTSPHLDDARLDWRKSTYSTGQGSDCVELASDGEHLLARDSKHPDGDRLRFGRSKMRSLITAVKSS